MMWFIQLLAKIFNWNNDMPSLDNNPEVSIESPPKAQNSPLDPISVPGISNANKFIESAKSCLGENLSLGTGVSPEVACAISVNKVHTKAFGVPIGGGASTQELYQVLLKHPDFKEVSTPLAGCVCIAPTGYGTDPRYPHGHVGIVGNFGICSNDSSTGLFSENYTIESWAEQFGTIEGYPTYWFLRI